MRKRLVFIFVSVLMLLCLPSLSTAKMSDEDFLELCKTGTPAEIIKAIKDGAKDLGTTGFDNLYGHGRINVQNTLLSISGL